MNLHRVLAIAILLACELGAVPSAQASLQQTVYSIVANGTTLDDGAIVLRDGHGALYVKVSDAKRWRLSVPASATVVPYAGENYVALRDLQAAHLQIDESASKVTFAIPTQAFRSDVTSLVEFSHAPAHRAAGAFLNYELHGMTFGAERSASGDLEQGISTGSGVFRNELSYGIGSGGTPVLSRLGTSFLIDQPSKLREIRIGDTQSAQDDIGHAVNLAGISVASDFGIDPSFMYYPGINVAGSAAVPTALDLYVNNVLQLQKNVNQGPYQLNNIPVMDGAGDVTVMTTDAAGTRHYETVPYYFTHNVLKPGLNSYAYSIGYVRNAYTGRNQYGPLIAVITERHGFTPSFTAGVHLESDAGTSVAGVSSDWVLKRGGAFSASLAESAGAGIHGLFAHVAWSYSSLRYRFGAVFESRDPSFRSADSLGLGDVFAGDTFQFSASTNVGRNSFASVMYTSTLGRAGDLTEVGGTPFAWNSTAAPEALRFVSGSLSRALRNRVRATITAYQTLGAGGFALQGNLTIPLGKDRMLTQSFGHAASGSNTTEIDQQLPDSGMGLGYDVSFGEGSQHLSTLDIYRYAPQGVVNVDAQFGSGSPLFEADASGSFVYADHAILPAQRVSGAFGVVEVPGEAGVPVYVNERLVGTTNRDGKVAIPFLAGFSDNKVTIDISKLPLDVDVADTAKTLTPYNLSAAVARFELTKAASVTLNLRKNDKEPVPPGSVVRLIGSQITSPVGLDGLVYLSPVPAGAATIEADMGVDGKCRAGIVIPADTANQPNLGVVVCTPGP